MTFFKAAIALLSSSIAFSCIASDYKLSQTENGTEYGFHQGAIDGKLALIITTNIDESMTDKYTPIGSLLKSAGYSIAAIDVPCHGKDTQKGKADGLVCWNERASDSSSDVLEPFVSKLKDVIADIKTSSPVDTSSITLLGVSRGGYLAFKAGAEISEVSTIIAMAPVTDVFRLREFSNSKASPGIYNLGRYYPALAKKHIFIQINNNDDRVGTAESISLIAGVSKAAEPNAADLTAILTPSKGHSTSEHEMAAQWAIRHNVDDKINGKGLSAPN